MRYHYHCLACGHEDNRDYAMHDLHPDTIPCPHCSQDECCSYCFGNGLRRDYTVGGMNLGYRPHLHDQNEQFKFKNL